MLFRHCYYCFILFLGRTYYLRADFVCFKFVEQNLIDSHCHHVCKQHFNIISRHVYNLSPYQISRYSLCITVKLKNKCVLFYIIQKIITQITCFSKIYHHTPFPNPVLNGASLSPISSISWFKS